MKEFRSRRLRVWENINRTMQEFKVLLLGYRSYTALLTQTGTDAPVATVLENNLGQVNVVRNTAGNYSFVSNGLFLQNKTTINHKSVVSDDINYVMNSYISSVNSIDFSTFDTFTQSDNVLSYPLSVEIRVYN